MEVPQINYNESLLIDYRWFDAKSIEPQYEFGYGLSYTTFEYSGSSISQVSSQSKRNNTGSSGTSSNSSSYTVETDPSLYADFVSVSYQIKNNGPAAGSEVSQLYLAFPPTAGEPPKVLRDFEKTYLESGSSCTISIKLTKKAFSIWNVQAQKWTIPEGDFQIQIGSSSRYIRLTKTLSMASTTA